MCSEIQDANNLWASASKQRRAETPHSSSFLPEFWRRDEEVTRVSCQQAEDRELPSRICEACYPSVVCEIAFGDPLKTPSWPLQAVRSYWEMRRERSTAQTDFTAHRNNKGQRKYLCAVFNISAVETESARRFSSGLMANPELLLAKKHVPQVPQTAGALISLALTLGCALPARWTLPSWRFSRTIEIYSQHPAVSCRPWSAIRSAAGRAGSRW
jgi:hypothetical protein